MQYVCIEIYMPEYSENVESNITVFPNIPNHAPYSQTQYSIPTYSIVTLVDAGESTLAKAAPKDSALRLVCLGFQQSSRCKESMQCWKCCMILSHWGIGALARSAKPGSDRSLTFMTCIRCQRKLDQIVQVNVIDINRISSLHCSPSTSSAHCAEKGRLISSGNVENK